VPTWKFQGIVIPSSPSGFARALSWSPTLVLLLTLPDALAVSERSFLDLFLFARPASLNTPFLGLPGVVG